MIPRQTFANKGRGSDKGKEIGIGPDQTKV